jgi:RNase P protein component
VLRSLQGDRAFQRLRKGRSGGSKHLSVRLRPAHHGQVRLGVVVSRKVGKAVVRNRVRRRLREAMLALLRARLPARAGGCDEASGRGEADARAEAGGRDPSADVRGASGPAAHRAPAWPPSFDLLVLTRPSAAEADYHELSRSLAKAIDRAMSTPAHGGARSGDRRPKALAAAAGAA